MTLARKFAPLKNYLLENSDIYQNMNTNNIVFNLNSKSITEYNRMTIANMQEKLTALGKGINVATFLASIDESTAGLRRYLDMMLNGKQEDFNLMHPSAQALMNQLVSLNIIDASDKTALEDEITETKSIMESLNLPDATETLINQVKLDLGWEI